MEWLMYKHIMCGGFKEAVLDFVAFGYWGVDKKYLKKEKELKYIWE